MCDVLFTTSCTVIGGDETGFEGGGVGELEAGEWNFVGSSSFTQLTEGNKNYS